MFYLFFIMFMQSYLQKRMHKILTYLRVAFECILVGFYWVDPIRNKFIGNYTFTNETHFNIYTAQVEANTIYLIRNSILCFLLFIGLIYTTVRMFRTKLTTERYNLAKLAGAQFAVTLSLVIQLIVNPALNIVKAAPMHDIGKIAVDDIVLRKPGKFTDEEYAKMKRHSAEDAKMLQKILSEVNDEYFKQIAINLAPYHHERYDGKGYPNGVSGENIPLEARIMALAFGFNRIFTLNVQFLQAKYKMLPTCLVFRLSL